jgi:hypothetical protein
MVIFLSFLVPSQAGKWVNNNGQGYSAFLCGHFKGRLDSRRLIKWDSKRDQWSGSYNAVVQIGNSLSHRVMYLCTSSLECLESFFGAVLYFRRSALFEQYHDVSLGFLSPDDHYTETAENQRMLGGQKR